MATRVALIVNTYNQPEYLERVLAAASRQTLAPAEVLAADDGSGDATRRAFESWAHGQPFPCAHVWQEHQGFRRSRILNQAIARARAEYLVFLDGDTVPHPRFVADHAALAQAGWFVQGHRALISQRGSARFGLGTFASDRWRALFSGAIGGWQNAFRWPRPWTRARTDLRGVRGCNLGIWREDLLAVNGYNEAFVGWGREDSELVVRLLNRSIRRRDARGWALCYHLWHPPASRVEVPRNDRLLADAIATRATRCEAGVAQHLQSAP